MISFKSAITVDEFLESEISSSDISDIECNRRSTQVRMASSGFAAHILLTKDVEYSESEKKNWSNLLCFGIRHTDNIYLICEHSWRR